MSFGTLEELGWEVNSQHCELQPEKQPFTDKMEGPVCLSRQDQEGVRGGWERRWPYNGLRI